MRTELVIRFDYGSFIPWVRQTDDGLVAIAGPDLIRIETDVAMHGENFRTVGEFTVEAATSRSAVARRSSGTRHTSDPSPRS